MYNLVRLTSEWNKELLISIMSASDAQRGQGTYSDTRNTLGVVKLSDLLGFGVSRDSRRGGLGAPPHQPWSLAMQSDAGCPGRDQELPRGGITSGCLKPRASLLFGGFLQDKGWGWLPHRAAQAREGASRAVTCAYPSRCASRRRHKKVLSYSDLPRRKQDWQRWLRSQPSR